MSREVQLLLNEKLDEAFASVAPLKSGELLDVYHSDEERELLESILANRTWKEVDCQFYNTYADAMENHFDTAFPFIIAALAYCALNYSSPNPFYSLQWTLGCHRRNSEYEYMTRTHLSHLSKPQLIVLYDIVKYSSRRYEKGEDLEDTIAVLRLLRDEVKRQS